MMRCWRGSIAGFVLAAALVVAGGMATAPAADRDVPDAKTSLVGEKAGDERAIGGLRLCWCPPGTFSMGSPATEPDRRADEGPVQVTLTRGFWAGKFEVTQGEWKRVVGPLPGGIGEGEGDDFAVHSVNYPEALEFCRRLTAQARDAGELPEGWAFRLPTEAEWEYACRAGTTTATAFGESLDRTQANFAGESYNTSDGGPSLNRASKVGRYPPNAWGLCDMHGNQFEWCLDWYHRQLPGGVDPDLSGQQGERNRDGTYSRVRRGGAFPELGKFCRSALRLRYEPERISDHIGFRVVLGKSG